MSSYQESSTSIDEDPTFSDIRDDSFAPSLTRDSVITYTTDLEDSSVLSSTTDLDRDVVEAPIKRKSIPVQHIGPPFYRRRRFWAICTACSIVSSAIFIPLLFLVIIPNIAQSSVNKSEMNFDAINITNPTNDSFIVSMSGTASGTGPFGAKITFNGPVDIFYNGNPLGSVELDPIEVSNGKGSLVGGKKLFTIKNKDVLNDFASKVLTATDFEWTLQGTANVKTLGMNINNLKLNKKIKILGSNSFQTTLLDLKITENPDKSLSMEAVANIYNPSPIGIEVGDMTAQLSYNQTLIATTLAKDVFLGAKGNNITMTGITMRPTTETDILNLITVVNGFLTNTPVVTTAKILSLLPPNGPVDWLNSAVKDFSLPAVVGNSSIPQKLIKNLDLGDENLVFTADDPYSPTISSTNAVADYELPFNINFTILEVGQKITISHDNKDVVSVESPEAPVISTNNQITLNISDTKLQVLDNDGFSNFLVDLTTKKETEVVVHGKTDIVANTDILGQTTVQGVPFNLTTTLQGFDQFNSDGSPPTVDDLTILHGDPDKLYLGILVTLTNPSKYSTSIGRVTFDMFYNDKQIGTTIIPDLSVVHGANPVQVAAILDSPGNNADTKELFTKFLTGQSATVNIKGNDQSTNIKSLVPAFKAINIPSTIPPLSKQFLQSAKIVLDNQTATTNISTSVVEISNPFLAPISIYTINSTFSFNGMVLGTLEEDFQDPIFIPGNTVLPLQLPVKMSFDPVSSFTILRTLAVQNNLDVTVLDSLIALTNVTVSGADLNAKPTPDAIKSFDLGKFVTTALANIPVTISMDSQVAIGECFLSMSYKQDIVATTDQTILNLIPALAAPLVNRMIDQSQMVFDSIFIQDIDVASFNTLASGQITNTGILPATISFPTGADVYSDNVYLGKASVPPISTDGSGAAKFNNISRFDIADIPTFASFSAHSYTAESVSMDFISDNVMITSFGLPIGPISIKKSFQMDGFNGLKQFTVGGITFPFAVTINVDNPSKVGVDLGKVVYDLSVNSDHISTITSDSVIIHPNSVSPITFHGDLNLTNISSIFTTSTPSTPPLITAQGISVSPPKATGEVVWLSETLKSFTLTAPFSLSSLINGNGPGGALPAAPAAPATPAAI